MPSPTLTRRDAGEEMIRVMTVQELIDVLSALDNRTLTVRVEGCDCIRDATGVRVDEPLALAGEMFPYALIGSADG